MGSQSLQNNDELADHIEDALDMVVVSINVAGFPRMPWVK